MTDEAAKQAAKKRIVKELEHLGSYSVHNANQLDSFFSLDEEFKQSEKIQEAIRKGFQKFLQKNAYKHPYYELDEESTEQWQTLFKKFSFEQEAVDETVINALRGACQDLISENEQGYSKGDSSVILALATSKFFKNQQLILKADIQKEIISAIAHKFGIHVSAEFLSKIPLTQESLENEDVIEIAKLKFQEETRFVLSPDKINLAKSLQEKFGLERSFVLSCLRAGISHDIDFGFNYDGIKAAQEVFELTDEEFFQFVADGLTISSLSKEKYRDSMPERLEHLLEQRQKNPDNIPPDDILLQALPLAIRDSLKTVDKPDQIIALNKFYAALGGDIEIVGQQKEVQEAYRTAIKRWLEVGDVAAAQKVSSLLDGKNNPTVSIKILRD